MNGNWKKAKEIFAAALELGPNERAKLLDEACVGDSELRREVESLLASDDSANSFLKDPAISEVADMIAPALRFEKGRLLGQYEILEFIGSGGMGEVYLARDTRLNREVALKFLSAAISGDENRLSRFRREALSVSALNHPNILTIFELAAEDEVPFIASEFVKGETLAKRSRSEGWGLRELLDIIEQTAFALEAAHKAGIIHRDIKPENIMVRDDGIVKVLDFGLAKLVGPDLEVDGGLSDPGDTSISPRITNSSGVLGTVAYMSPEQASGRRDIDSRTDIWSLGVVIYEMLSGTTPFPGESAVEVIAGILNSTPEPLTTHADGVPPELIQIVEMALQKDREKRFENSSDLLAAIRRLKSDLEFQSKLESDPRVQLKLKPPAAARNAGETSPVRPTEYVRALNLTKEPADQVTAETETSRTTTFRKFRPKVYAKPALFVLIIASVVFGGAFLGSTWMKLDHYVVDTISNDPGMNACTSAPDDCSFVGAMLSANTDGHPDTIEFDPAIFESHQTIKLLDGFGLDPDGKITIIGPPSGVTLMIAENARPPNSQFPVISRLFALNEPSMALEIRNLTLKGGSSFQGGAIYNEKGTTTIINSIITGNYSTEAGGAIANRHGSVVVVDSTISNNTSLTGGGIANISGKTTLINTIVSGNNAPLGGGIRNERGEITLINSTLSENSATTGGGLFNYNGTTSLYNSIIADSKDGGDCHLYGDTINAFHSLIEDGLTCVNGSNVNNITGDPRLSITRDSDGKFTFYSLMAGSIAIDSGNVAFAVDALGQPLATDRNGTGFPRISGRSVDLGAIEYRP